MSWFLFRFDLKHGNTVVFHATLDTKKPGEVIATLLYPHSYDFRVPLTSICFESLFGLVVVIVAEMAKGWKEARERRRREAALWIFIWKC